MNNLHPSDFHVETLGKPTILSPIKMNDYIGEDEKILFDINPETIEECKKNGKGVITLERSGPREKIFFDPKNSKAAIVTCGGLCPGINNVIRSVSLELLFQYEIKSVTGYQYGFKGIADERIETIDLNSNTLAGISERGGSILSSSRGPQDVVKMVDRLEKDNINLLFVIGGDGTLRGGADLTREIKKRKVNIGIIGIPKTIDNDLSFISKSFGFETAYSKAVETIQAVHTESLGAYNCIGIVKVMGRHSGAIACHASIASLDVNFCLIPEVPFSLDDPGGFLPALKNRILTTGHAVIVIAEGAAREHIPDTGRTDASGNIRLGDSGTWLKELIENYMSTENVMSNVKYIDPSYLLRAIPADPNDALYCTLLGQYAVHAAMSGRTNMVIGQWNHYFINLPIEIVTRERKMVNTNGSIWKAVLESTGQNITPL
ncbi:MAG: ATP-dependent 6-phosphofructokinase [Leptospirales bacterium]